VCVLSGMGLSPLLYFSLLPSLPPYLVFGPSPTLFLAPCVFPHKTQAGCSLEWRGEDSVRGGGGGREGGREGGRRWRVQTSQYHS